MTESQPAPEDLIERAARCLRLHLPGDRAREVAEALAAASLLADPVQQADDWTRLKQVLGIGGSEPLPSNEEAVKAAARLYLDREQQQAELERLRVRESELETQVVKQKSIAQYEANRWRQSAYLSTLQRDYERARAELRKLNEAIIRRNATTLRSRREADRLLECVDELTAERDLALWLHAEATWRLQDDKVATYNLYVRVVAALGPRFSITAPWHGLAEAVAQIVAERDHLQKERDTWEGEYERVRDLKLTDLADALAERDELQHRIDRALSRHQNNGTGQCTCGQVWVCDTWRVLQADQPAESEKPFGARLMEASMHEVRRLAAQPGWNGDDGNCPEPSPSPVDSGEAQAKDGA